LAHPTFVDHSLILRSNFVQGLGMVFGGSKNRSIAMEGEFEVGKPAHGRQYGARSNGEASAARLDRKIS
jgi:hypothetical protein